LQVQWLGVLANMLVKVRYNSHHDKSTNCDIRIVGEQYKGDPYSPDYDLFRVEVVCPNSMNISFRMNESSLKNNTHMIIDGKPVSLKKIIEESEK